MQGVKINKLQKSVLTIETSLVMNYNIKAIKASL